MDKRTKEYKQTLAGNEKMNYLHKVEEFNGDSVPEVAESGGIGNWTEEEKIGSIINTIRILPPNMIKNGRHIKENIQALNVFKVTDALIDKAYSKFQHD